MIALSYELSAHNGGESPVATEPNSTEASSGAQTAGNGQVHVQQPRYDTPPPCFNTDVVKFREINAR